LLSWETTIGVVIASELMRAGVKPRIAARAGMTFAHTNGGNPQRKAPCTTYQVPKAAVATMLCVAGEEIRIFPVSGVDGFKVISALGQGAGTLLEVGQIIQRVETFCSAGWRA
jgi:hypothetical protein